MIKRMFSYTRAGTLVLSLTIFGTLHSPIAKTPLDLFTTGLGSWVFLSKESDARSYFNKLPVSIYLSAYGFKAYAAVPLQWTVETKNGKIEQQLVRVADASFYIGREFLFLEPRLGLVIPTMYRTDKAWIGSRNIKLQIGMGLNSEVRQTKIFNISAEFLWRPYLSESNALAYRGSWDLLSSSKISFRPKEKFKFGVEILASAKKSYWIWLDHDQYEVSIGLVPNIYAEIGLSSSVFLSPKLGFGSNLAKTSNQDKFVHSGNTVNMSLSLNIYP